EAAQCDIVVIAAGSKTITGKKPVKSFSTKISLIRSIIQAMRPFRSDTILIIVANAVDLLTSLAQRISGLPACQVLGLGTFLDSVRHREMVADIPTDFQLDTISVNSYILGLHGEDHVVAWSTATISEAPKEKLLLANRLNRNELADKCQSRSQTIIRAKGIRTVVANICLSIFLDKSDVSPVSHYQPDLSSCFSMPAAIGRKGIISTQNII
ncbi:LDH C-terminal domain-like protein, partial [Colletotrichum zoysiae]